MVEYYEIAEFLKNFSDASRVKIVLALIDEELSVNDIATKVGMTQTAVSYQLRILRDSRIVKYRREAQTIFYTIDDEHINKLLSISSEHLEERKSLWK